MDDEEISYYNTIQYNIVAITVRTHAITMRVTKIKLHLFPSIYTTVATLWEV